MVDDVNPDVFKCTFAHLTRGMPFSGCFRGSSWNGQAFFCHEDNQRKYSANRSLINTIMQCHDFLGVQETHSTDDREAAFNAEYGNQYKSFWSHLNTRQGGVGLILSQRFFKQIDSHAWI